MNAEECARLVSVVRTLYPAQRFDDNPANVVNAWGHVVADVTYSEAHAAVIRLARRGVQWVSPGDVRREAAAARNVLAPDVDDLLADVREVARREGVGRRALHPAAQRAYDAVGGALSIVRMDSRGLLQLRRVIEDAAQRHDLKTLDDVLPAPAPAHVPISARPVESVPELEPAPPKLDTEEYAARVDKLREFVEGGES